MTAFSEGFDSSVCSRMMHSAASLQRGSILVCKANRAGTKPASPFSRYALIHPADGTCVDAHFVRLGRTAIAQRAAGIEWGARFTFLGDVGAS